MPRKGLWSCLAPTRDTILHFERARARVRPLCSTAREPGGLGFPLVFLLARSQTFVLTLVPEISRASHCRLFTSRLGSVSPSHGKIPCHTKVGWPCPLLRICPFSQKVTFPKLPTTLNSEVAQLQLLSPKVAPSPPPPSFDFRYNRLRHARRFGKRGGKRADSTDSSKTRTWT